MQLFEPKPQTDPSKNCLIVREHIKRACYHTGILGKPTVLLIHEGLGEDCLQDVACLMNEGENDKEINPKNMGFVLSLSLHSIGFNYYLCWKDREFWLDISDTDTSLICMVLLFKSTLKWCNGRLKNDVEFPFFFKIGTSPGLYTDEEIQNIVSAVMPGGVTTKRVDKIEIALERFLKKIRQNLHVVVCMNYRGMNIFFFKFCYLSS